MDSLEKIVWDENMSVDIKEIDDLQQKMFALLNVLIEMKDTNADAKDCANMVAEINEYSRYYFSKEEEYLKACGYPEVREHLREHRYFLKSTITLRRQVVDDKNSLTYESIKQLKDWLLSHISSVDARYVPFIRINNYIKESRASN